jgi:hypothetical protein
LTEGHIDVNLAQSFDPLVAYWGVTRKIRMIPLTRERKFLTHSSTRLER